MVNVVYAMGQGGAEGAQGGLGAFVPLILMFVIFYFLLIRPQQKKQKEHQEMIRGLRKGDRVMLNGGIYGRITSLDESTLSVEIADKVRVKVNRSYVAALTHGQTEKESKAEPEKLKSK
ncbi:preprotein translocase subunit YajC [Desulfobacterales bacterium HSG2]|nr:preprotein translocase subunit YajC [Desulfobacterales bacterium HSG2]